MQLVIYGIQYLYTLFLHNILFKWIMIAFLVVCSIFVLWLFLKKFKIMKIMMEVVMRCYDKYSLKYLNSELYKLFEIHHQILYDNRQYLSRINNLFDIKITHDEFYDNVKKFNNIDNDNLLARIEKNSARHSLYTQIMHTGHYPPYTVSEASTYTRFTNFYDGIKERLDKVTSPILGLPVRKTAIYSYINNINNLYHLTNNIIYTVAVTGNGTYLSSLDKMTYDKNNKKIKKMLHCLNSDRKKWLELSDDILRCEKQQTFHQLFNVVIEDNILSLDIAKLSSLERCSGEIPTRILDEIKEDILKYIRSVRGTNASGNTSYDNIVKHLEDKYNNEQNQTVLYYLKTQPHLDFSELMKELVQDGLLVINNGIYQISSNKRRDMDVSWFIKILENLVKQISWIWSEFLKLFKNLSRDS